MSSTEEFIEKERNSLYSGLIWIYGNCATLYPVANEAVSSHVTQIPHWLAFLFPFKEADNGVQNPNKGKI